MAKNRTMQEKNARVKKADMLASKERKILCMAMAVKMDEASETTLIQIGHRPSYGNHEREIARHSKINPMRRYKSEAKTALISRL